MEKPKSQFSKDRRGKTGKGDLHRGPLGVYRNGEFFGRSNCCSMPIIQIHGKNCCEKCSEYCLKTLGGE